MTVLLTFSVFLQETDNCSLSSLTTLLLSTPKLQSTGLSQLIQIPDKPALVRNGSYIVFSCMSGYGTVGGSLTVTCSDGSWTQFPTCVPLVHGEISVPDYFFTHSAATHRTGQAKGNAQV